MNALSPSLTPESPGTELPARSALARSVVALLPSVAVAVSYLATARLGFELAFVAEQVTTVWAPTGIAQAALLLGGRRLWPAVWLGAFAANAGTMAPLWTAAIIATGNTLEAVALAWILPRHRFDPGLSRFADASRLIVFGAFIVTAISATVGVGTLCAAAVQPWHRFADLWSSWWLGDALGALTVTPLLLTLARSMREPSVRAWLHVALMAAIGGGVAALVFGAQLGPLFGRGPLHYVLFPVAIIAAVRCGQPATALTVFVVSAMAIVYTVSGYGPFSASDVNSGLVLLQAFMAVLAGTGLLLAAAMTERHTAQRRLGAAHAVGEALADAADLRSAAPAILRRICGGLQWRFGAVWTVDADGRWLTCLASWGDNAPALERFGAATRQFTFERGRGLPGRVWETGRAAWIEDVIRDGNFPRAPLAAAAGLHAGFGFPIRSGGEVLGVIEFFTHRVVAPDPDLLDAMSTIGHQIGQFISRTRGEESVRRSEERFRTLAASASALTLYEQDRQLRYRWVFPQHPGFADRTIGRTDSELLPGAEGERVSALKHAVLVTGVGRRDEIRVTLGDEVRTYDLMIEPRRDAAGAVIGVAGVAVDITERQRQEELLRSSQAQLRDADRRKDEFLAMLAHELRNPLAPIRTGLELMRMAGAQPEALERLGPMMERQIAHMVRLVDDLMDVSRITSGKIHLQKEPALLAELVQAAIDVHRAAIDGGGVRLEVELPDRPVTILVDPTRFVQVISNLLHNAAKYTEAGGRIAVRAEMSGEALVVSVSDTGIGIDLDLLPRVFDLFTQGRRVQAGLGIGLSLAQRIVELHGGRIDAHSGGAGRGSTFTVRLPGAVARLAPPAVEGTTAAPASRAIDRRVLVVDDNDDAAETLAWLVRSFGGETRIANDGATAIRTASEFDPHVVLLDIGLPDVDGYEVCRQLRRSDTGRRTLVVAVTGWGQARDKARAAAAGFDAHLTKPADPATVEELLSKRG